MASLLSPRSGLTPGADILDDGVANVLRLRTKFGSGTEPLSDASRYIDLGYLKAAQG